MVFNPSFSPSTTLIERDINGQHIICPACSIDISQTDDISRLDTVDAQCLYTAVMTDTLLEECSDV